MRRVGIDARKGASGVELLALLERQFGGAAEKANDDAATSMERLNVQVENAKESLGTLALPVVSNLADQLGTAAEERPGPHRQAAGTRQGSHPEIKSAQGSGRRQDIGDIVGKSIREGTKRRSAKSRPAPESSTP